MSNEAVNRELYEQKLVVRDEYGSFFHPDLPDGDESTDIRPLIEAQGFECDAVWGESDDEAFPEEVMDDSGGDSYWAALAAWNPAKGEHEGWLIAAVMDTEDGPMAWLVRPKESGASDG